MEGNSPFGKVIRGPNMVKKNGMKACVIGLGRVGLPHALVSADVGNQVWGVDINRDLIKNLKKGKVQMIEPGLEKLLKKNLNRNFFPTTDLGEAVRSSDVIVNMIGTLITGHDYRKEVDLSNIQKLATNLAGFDLRGKIIIFRTTLPLGGTDETRKLIEKKSGLKCGEDFHMAFCPERCVEGKAVQEERNLPKVIGAYNDKGYKIAERYFRSLGGKITRVKDTRTAEFVKLIDNAYRSMIFSFSNDLALLAEYNEINVIEAINAANFDYRRNNLFPPSCGVGGYCLSKDPYYLELAFEPIRKKRGFGSVWHCGRKANDYMPLHLLDVEKNLVEKHKPKSKTIRVLVCGLAYKGDVDDTRLAHGVDIVKGLLATPRHDVTVYDPLVKEIPPEISGKVKVAPKIGKAFEKQDCAIFTVNHGEFLKLRGEGIERLVKKMNQPAIILDGWNIFPSLKGREKVVYWGPGNV